jgi:hypothetical protein
VGAKVLVGTAKQVLRQKYWKRNFLRRRVKRSKGGAALRCTGSFMHPEIRIGSGQKEDTGKK